MSRQFTRMLIASLVLVLPGCSLIINNIGAKRWDEKSRRDLAATASFDMSCPKERLELSLLVGKHWHLAGSHAGVVGCDQKLRYVLTSSGWVLNSDSH